jgi:hypothetical protein
MRVWRAWGGSFCCKSVWRSLGSYKIENKMGTAVVYGLEALK